MKYFIGFFIFQFSLYCYGEADALDSLLKKYEEKINSDKPQKSIQNENLGNQIEIPSGKFSPPQVVPQLEIKAADTIRKVKLKKRVPQSIAVPQKKPQTGILKSLPKPSEVPLNSPGTQAPIPNDASTPNPAEKKEEDSPGLFGSWFGMKKSGKENGLDFNIVYKGDSVTTISGTAEKKSVFLGNIDVTVSFDFEKIFGLKGLSLFLYGLGNHGDHPSEFIGDSFGTSNIEASNTFKAYEVYLRQAIDEHSSLLIGLRDLNADFYSIESSKPLLNSAFGISPSLSQTGVNGPSIFPVTAPAISFNFNSPTSFYFQVAAFNAQAGNPEDPKGTFVANSLQKGLLNIAELGFSGDGKSGNYKYGLGLWGYDKKFDTIDTELGQAENNGLYVLLDHGFTKQFSAFIKYGTASQSINQFSSAIEVGLNYKGVIDSRPDDRLVVGFAQANAGDDYSRINEKLKSESALEIAYSIDFGSGIKVTPDYQFVKNPGMVVDSKPVEIGSVRIEIQF